MAKTTPELMATLERLAVARSAYREIREQAQFDGCELALGIMKRNNISLRRLADWLEVSPSYLSKVLRGHERMSDELAATLLCFSDRFPE